MRVTVPSLAKLNLDLRVLHKRPDGYHELRTIFQTISLGDRLQIGFEAGRRTSIELGSSVEIADNLAARAARFVCDRLKVRGRVTMVLEKRIPMGAGLGGGSSNAAAVLQALPALAGLKVEPATLATLGAELGSDVPFFLYGGTALGLGTGTELYPLPDLPAWHAVVVATGAHVSTAQAYQALGRSVTNALTTPADFPILREFQAVAWALSGMGPGRFTLTNDFEKPVFAEHPEVAAAVRKLRRLGAVAARMTGSGSAVFGLFPKAAEGANAAAAFGAGQAYPVRFVTRKRYAALWQRALPPAPVS